MAVIKRAQAPLPVNLSAEAAPHFRRMGGSPSVTGLPPQGALSDTGTCRPGNSAHGSVQKGRVNPRSEPPFLFAVRNSLASFPRPACLHDSNLPFLTTVAASSIALGVHVTVVVILFTGLDPLRWRKP